MLYKNNIANKEKPQNDSIENRFFMNAQDLSRELPSNATFWGRCEIVSCRVIFGKLGRECWRTFRKGGVFHHWNKSKEPKTAFVYSTLYEMCTSLLKRRMNAKDEWEQRQKEPHLGTLWVPFGASQMHHFSDCGGKNFNWKWSMVLHNFLEVCRRICTHYYEKMLVLELSAVWDFILMECKMFLFVKWICWSISDVSQLVYGTPEPFDWLGLHPWLLH